MVKKQNVKDRVAGAAGKDVATTQEKPLTLADQINRMAPQFERAMPAHMDGDKLARIALTEVRKNPKLGECSPESFFGALMQAAQLGTEPGPLGSAYLVPYYNRKLGSYECQFIIGYRGMLDLVARSGKVKGTPKARIVYENDDFALAYELEEEAFRHVPWYLRRDEKFTEGGEVIGAYVIARLVAGGADIHYSPIEAIEKRRKRSMAKDNGPWKTDYEAMVLKTAVRAAFPWLPVSTELASKVAASDGNVTRIAPGSLNVVVDDLTTKVIDVDGDTVDPATGEVVEEGQPEPDDNAAGEGDVAKQGSFLEK